MDDVIYDFKLPQLSATMEEATVVGWLKQPGDFVAAGEAMIEIETDKAVLEVESPKDGYLEEAAVAEGESVALGQLIARLRLVESKPPAPVETPSVGASQALGESAPQEDGRVLASPAARRLAREHGIDLSRLKGTGQGGRIGIEDVERALALQSEDEGKSPQGQTQTAGAKSDRDPAVDAGSKPMAASLRRRIAETVTASHREIPAFWVERWVDVEPALADRERLNSDLRGRPKATFTDYVLQAVAELLDRHPRFRVRYAGPDVGEETIAAPGVGLVVSVPGGIVIPTLLDLSRRSILEIAELRHKAVAEARAGRLPLSAFAPATITVSNVGPSGADRFRALVYPGQSAILAVGRIHERVVPMGRAIGVRQGCYLNLTVDHRVIDGLDASAFVGGLALRLERGDESDEPRCVEQA